MDQFLPQKGKYRNLRCFQIAESIFDLTYDFCNRFLPKGDRTIDQMVQAARSGKQNIAEGSAAATTSKETEIKLTNVAKASLQELLLDYEDFIVTRRLIKWSLDDARTQQTRQILRENHDRSFYLQKSEQWSAETMANVLITMIHQCDRLLAKLIESQKQRFLQEGGIKEAMTRARLEYRNSQSTQSPPSPAPDAPQCPECGAPMLKRVAKKGSNSGKEFWSCSDYPNCRVTRPINYQKA